MASKKITAMPNWAGNQAPTDLVTGVDLSEPAATQNVKSTLNDLFSIITKNITDGAVRFQGFAAPAVSAAGAGSLYFSTADNTFKGSRNGGAYQDLLFGSGANTQIGYWGTTVDEILGSASWTFNNSTKTVTLSNNSNLPNFLLQNTTAATPNEFRAFINSPTIQSIGFDATGNGAVLNLYGGRTGPLFPLSTALVGSIRMRGVNGAGVVPTTVGGVSLNAIATENLSLTNGGTGFTLRTAANGETSDTVRFTITGSGAVIVGANGTGPTATLGGTSTQICLGNLTTYNANAAIQCGNPFTGNDNITFLIQGNPGQTQGVFRCEQSTGQTLYLIGIAGSHTYASTAVPAVSPANQGRIYYDTTAQKFKVSENGGAYVDMIGGGTPAGSNKQIQFNNSSSFGGATGFEYQAGASPNVTITAQNASHTALRVSSAATPSVNVFSVSADAGATTHFSVQSDGAPSSPQPTFANTERYGQSSRATGANATAFGFQALAQTTRTTAFGSDAVANATNAIAIGVAVSVTSAHSIGIGRALGITGVSQTNSFVASFYDDPISNVYFGKGITHPTPTGYAINGTGGDGLDIAGGNLTLAGGRGSGTGAGGSVLIQTAPAGSSGVSLNALSTVATFNQSLESIFAGLVGINKSSSIGAQLHVVSSDAAIVGMIVDTASGPSADIVRFRIDGNNCFVFAPNGTLTAGLPSTTTGTITLANSAGSTTTSLRAGNAASSLVFLLPVVDPTAGQVLSASAPSGGVVTLSWATAGGSSAWSALTNPTGNLSLTMAANTSTFTYNATTGASDLYTLTNGSNDTGTGYILAIATPGASNAKKAFGVTARGSLAFEITATGAPSAPGTGTNSERFGAGSVNTASGANNLIFGNGSATGVTNNAILIGTGWSVANQGTVVMIGTNNTSNTDSANKIFIGTGSTHVVNGSVVIGNGALFGFGNNASSVAVGHSINVSGSGSGSGSLALLGHGITITAAAVSAGIGLGTGTTLTASNQFVAGSNGAAINDIYFGKGVTNATPTAYAINGTGGSGTNIAGATVNLFAGRPTGNASPGNIAHQFARPGSSGTTLATQSDQIIWAYATDAVNQTWQIQTSTTANTDAVRIQGLWTTATHASRTSALAFLTVDNAGALTERVRIGGGTYGVTITSPAALQTALSINSASGGGTANTLQSVWTTTDTNVIGATAIWQSRSTGTAAAGFGASFLCQLESSTTNDQDAAEFAWLWTTATHASRTSAISLRTIDNAGALTERVRVGGGQGVSITSPESLQIALVLNSAAGGGTAELINAVWNTTDTAVVGAVQILNARSTGTPAAGFGASLLGNLESSTTDDQEAARWSWSWHTATHASRTSWLKWAGVNNGGGLTDTLKLKGDGRLFVTVLNSAPTDADLDNSMVTLYLDQTANKMHFRVKYSDGTLKTGEVALT